MSADKSRLKYFNMKNTNNYKPPIIEKLLIESEQGLAIGSVNPTIVTPVINEEEGTGTSIWNVDDF